MRLEAITIKNFRSFKNPTRVTFASLTGIIGRNDVGKSTILEALDIFFEGGECELDSDDLSKDAGDDRLLAISCEFTNLPESLTLDTTTQTTLADEQLLNSAGRLEVKKVWDCGRATPKGPSIYAVALHATLEDGTSPLSLTRTKLRQACTAARATMTEVNQNENPPMRRALRATLNQPTEALDIELEKEDGKAVWAAIQKHMPTFALFKSDRGSTDGDSEVQSPLKTAVKLAVGAAEDALADVVQQVELKTREVLDRTLAKLTEMDPTLAAELRAEFATPKWDTIFKASLRTENEIPLNKRGSGVRRLILLNFFRAEAERMAEELGRPLLYAIEEPETSQHPDNQRMLIEALIDLADSPNVQVIVTTHVPALAGLIPTGSLRLVDRDQQGLRTVREGDENIYGDIAATLGIIADKRLEVLVCVEGPTDVDHLKAINRLHRQQHVELPDFDNDPRVAIIPLGGATLEHWAIQHYLRKVGAREFHLYDRHPFCHNDPTVSKYQQACNEVNGRGPNFKARLTTKHEIENYVHPDAILAICGVQVQVLDDTDVEEVVKQAGAAARIPISKVKKKLVEAMQTMTLGQLQNRDEAGETLQWMRDVAALLPRA